VRGRGLGREYALMLAEQGAKVVVNDLGSTAAGEGADLTPASSASGLFGNVGQTNYWAAKAGIAAFTIISATELRQYGITSMPSRRARKPG
jgi:NAD(P)-dependent dehydrogenase (short-subunit alcohol dehydrogenase family)